MQDKAFTAFGIRGLAAVSGVVGAAVMIPFGYVAHADPSANQFLDLLNNAGVAYSGPDIASTLGSSICSLLEEPGGSFARAASKVGGTEGISPDSADMFTSIAISMYCPSMLASVAEGDWLGQLAIPRL